MDEGDDIGMEYSNQHNSTFTIDKEVDSLVVEPASVVGPLTHSVQHTWMYAWTGCSYLIPFHALLLQVDYMGALFLVTFAYMLPVTIGVVLLLRWLHVLSVRMRMILSYGGFTVCLISFIVADVMDLEGSRTLFILLSAIIGVCDALAQATVTGLAGECSPAALRAVLFGNAVAGVVAAATKIVVRLAVPGQAIRLSALIFFAIAAAQCVATLCLWLWRLKGAVNTTPREAGIIITMDALISTLRSTYIHVILLFILFFVTLLFYPGIASTFAASHIDPTWVPIFMLTAFNLGDFLGRAVCLIWGESISLFVCGNAKKNVILCLARIAFAPIFILALPRVSIIKQEVVPLTALFLFGASGGILASANASVGSSLCKTQEGGVMMSLSILVGLLTGSLTSLALSLIGLV